MFRVHFNLPNIFLCLIVLGAINHVKSSCNQNEQCVPISSCQTLNYNYTQTSGYHLSLYLRTSRCEGNEVGKENETTICCSTFENDLPDVNVCGPLSLPKKIKNGQAADIHDFPWMAVLEYKDADSTTPDYGCAGSLINQKYVLTAAHCLQKPDLFQVHLGVYHLRNETYCFEFDCTHPVFTVGVEKTIIHEEFINNDRSMANDIGLIRLSKKVHYTKFIRPICLPSTVQMNPANDLRWLSVAGWGTNGTIHRTDIKQKVGVEHSNYTKCKSDYAAFGRHLNESQQICAGGFNEAATCNGDSGAPLMSLVKLAKNSPLKKYAIVGIASFGLYPHKCGKWPGVFIRVSYFEQWIKDNIRI